MSFHFLNWITHWIFRQSPSVFCSRSCNWLLESECVNRIDGKTTLPHTLGSMSLRTCHWLYSALTTLHCRGYQKLFRLDWKECLHGVPWCHSCSGSYVCSRSTYWASYYSIWMPSWLTNCHLVHCSLTLYASHWILRCVMQLLLLWMDQLVMMHWGCPHCSLILYASSYPVPNNSNLCLSG